MKIMLDTQIYDLIIDTPCMADRLNQFSGQGKVVVVSTHIQEDELARILDNRKRVAVAKTTRKSMKTSGGVYGVSRYGQATYGNGSSGGASIKKVRSASGKQTRDALIATTAARDSDVLVTKDKRVANRIRSLSSSYEVWAFARLREYLFG